MFFKNDRHFLFIAVLIGMIFPGMNPLFSQENLIGEEKKFIQLRTQMQEHYREMDSYLDILLISLLAQQHVLAFGGPGGSKTETAKSVLDSMAGRTFNLQFSPSTKEEQIKGTLIGKKYLEEGKAEYHRDQSLLMHDYAILDEIDKAGAEVLSATLSVLNERKVMAGSEEVLGRLKTALITSNMTLHEFLEKFRNTNDGPTGKALLDRIGFKVLVLNHLSSAEEMHHLLRYKKSRMRNSQEDQQGKKSVNNQDVTCKDVAAEIAKIDLKYLQQKIARIEVPAEVEGLAILLWRRVRKVLQREQLDEQRQCLLNPKGAHPYMMTNQFSTRGFTQLIPLLQIAKYIEDLKFLHANPELELNFPEFKSTLKPEDIWFSHYGMIMQGPGLFEYNQQGESGGVGTEISGHKKNSGRKMLKKLKDEFAYEPRTLKMLTDLEKERNAFTREYETLLKGYQDELSSLSLAKFGISSRELDDFLSKDLTTLSLEQKTRLLHAMALVRYEIEKRRNEEKKLNDDEVSEGPEEIARIKVLSELVTREISLRSSTLFQQSMEEKLAEMEKEREKEREEQRKKEQERKHILTETSRKNPFPAGFEQSFQSGGLIWSKVLLEKYNWDKAINKPACPKPSRLPTEEEYLELAKVMASTGRYMANYFVLNPGFERALGDDGKHADFSDSWTWSSESLKVTYHKWAWIFEGPQGEVSARNQNENKDVRCVLEVKPEDRKQKQQLPY